MSYTFNELEKSFDDGNFFPYFQPVVNHDLVVIGFEVLIRWHKNGSVIFPSDFINTIENSSLI